MVYWEARLVYRYWCFYYVWFIIAEVSEYILSSFLKYFIDYTITVVPVFPLCPPPPIPPTPSDSSYTAGHVHGSCMYVLWLLYFLRCTLHRHDHSVTTNLHFWIRSLLLPIPLTASHLATIKMPSVSTILFLFCLFFRFNFW